MTAAAKSRPVKKTSMGKRNEERRATAAVKEAIKILGAELTKRSGFRVVAAWAELDSREYKRSDSEAPYEYRGQVMEILDEPFWWEDSHPNYDLPIYQAFLELAWTYGDDAWPSRALADYLDSIGRLEPQEEADEIWERALASFSQYRVEKEAATRLVAKKFLRGSEYDPEKDFV